MHKRPWVLEGAYPGMKPFVFGTVFASTYETAHKAALEEWARVLPFPPPAQVKMVPGSVVVRYDDDV